MALPSASEVPTTSPSHGLRPVVDMGSHICGPYRRNETFCPTHGCSLHHPHRWARFAGGHVV